MGREAHQGADLPAGRGQEEPREDAGPDRSAPGQDQVLQEADRGGRGDRGPQPGQVQAGAGQPDREQRASRPERAGLGQDPCTCSQRFHRTHVNNDLCKRPQLIRGQTLKLALRNIVVYLLPIYRLSVFTNVTLSKGIPPSIVITNQRINLLLQKKKKNFWQKKKKKKKKKKK